MTSVDERPTVPYLPRLVDAQLDRILATFPAALVLGPRASGKTTTARRMASNVVELDDILGRMLDTFVLAQLRPLLSLDTPPARAYHLRQYDGRREIDVVLEAADGRIVGLEIKATAAPTLDDARHLAWLRDQLGDRHNLRS